MTTEYLDGVGNTDEVTLPAVIGETDFLDGADEDTIDTGVGVADETELQGLDGEEDLQGLDGEDAEVSGGYNEVYPLAATIGQWAGSMAATKPAAKKVKRLRGKALINRAIELSLKNQVASSLKTLQQWKQTPKGIIPIMVHSRLIDNGVNELSTILRLWNDRKQLVNYLRGRAAVRNHYLRPFYVSLFAELLKLAQDNTGIKPRKKADRKKAVNGLGYVDDNDLNGTEEEMLNEASEILLNGADDLLDGLDSVPSVIAGTDDGVEVLLASADLTDQELSEMGLGRVKRSATTRPARRVAKRGVNKTENRTKLLAALQQGGGVLFMSQFLSNEFNSTGVNIKKRNSGNLMKALMKATGLKADEFDYSAQQGISNLYQSTAAAIQQLRSNNALAGADEIYLQGFDDTMNQADLGMGDMQVVGSIWKKIAQVGKNVIQNQIKTAVNSNPVAQYYKNANSLIKSIAPKASNKVSNFFQHAKQRIIDRIQNNSQPNATNPQADANRIREQNRAKIQQAINIINSILPPNAKVRASMDLIVTPADIAASVQGVQYTPYTDNSNLQYVNGLPSVVANAPAPSATEKSKFLMQAQEFAKKHWLKAVAALVLVFAVWFFFMKDKKKTTRRKKSSRVNGLPSVVAGAVGKAKRRKKRTTQTALPPMQITYSQPNAAPKRKKRKAAKAAA